MASSSAHNQQEQLPNIFNATAAPPPTPSSQLDAHHLTSAAAADALSRLLHRLPPTLSLPTRRSPSTTSLPLISLSESNSEDLLLSAATKLGFFQLTNHGIPSQLSKSAELESLSLFELDKDKKESWFPKNWPLGYDEDEDGAAESFWLDAACSNESSELCLDSLCKLTRGLEKVGLEIFDMISHSVGFQNPLRNNPSRFCTFLCLHKVSYGEKPVISGGFYPFIIGLQMQSKWQKFSLLSDSGWVTVNPQADSIMVSIGDIAQVWSNGKLKKVRGRPSPCNGDGNNSHCLSMSLFITPPLQSTISPLLPMVVMDEHDRNGDISHNKEEDHCNIDVTKKEERTLFRSFSFEDYAWRVYREPLIFKDPLDRYRI